MRLFLRVMLYHDWRDTGSIVKEEFAYACLTTGALETDPQVRSSQLFHRVMRKGPAPSPPPLWRMLLLELKVAVGWRARLRQLYKQVFPSADFMLRRAGVRNRIWLPALYVQRAGE